MRDRSNSLHFLGSAPISRQCPGSSGETYGQFEKRQLTRILLQDGIWRQIDHWQTVKQDQPIRTERCGCKAQIRGQGMLVAALSLLALPDHLCVPPQQESSPSVGMRRSKITHPSPSHPSASRYYRSPRCLLSPLLDQFVLHISTIFH